MDDLKTIGAHQYRIGKLPARTQFHLLRKVSPVLVRLDKLPALMGVAAEAGMESADRTALFLSALAPAINELAQMPNEDVDQILDLALNAVARREADGRFAAVCSSGGMMMYADITVQQMLEMVMLVLQENIGNFFDLLPTASS